jgi:hypothetical protein
MKGSARRLGWGGVVALLAAAQMACGAVAGATGTAAPGVTPAATTAAPAEAPATASPAPSPTPRPTPSREPPPEHRIGVRVTDGEAGFYDRVTGEAFVPRGANYFWIVRTETGFNDRFFGLDDFDAERVRRDFAALRARGYNTVRIFLDSCGGGAGCMGRPSGRGLNPPYLDNIVTTLRLAHEAGLYLLLTSNDLPETGGYWDQSQAGVSEFFGPYRNAHYLTAPGVAAGEAYWGDLLRGLAERGARFDAVLAWSLLNEQWYFYTDPPFSLRAGTVTAANGQSYDLADPAEHRRLAEDGMRHYIERLRRVIVQHDPTALVTMGFFVPDYPNPIRQGDFRYVETRALLEDAALDFLDFHAYPGFDGLPEIAENFGMLGYRAKPIILGEAGAFIDRYFSAGAASNAIQTMWAESCGLGFDGWLYWGLYRAPEAIGDKTWGLLDEDGLLLEALAPTARPDVCAPPVAAGGNLALGRPVRASGWLAEEPPQAAVDGQPAQWGSGAHPPQWIEIDLEEPATIGLIRLIVAQYPAGTTTHQVLARGPGEEFRRLHQFSGPTDEGQVLEFRPDPPAANVQYIRILTTLSPSWVAWREIEVYGP